MMTAAELIAFEEEIAELFNNAQIKAPVHFYNGNEEQIIEVFKEVRPGDWVMCSWRSHYQCLLKGVPPDEIRAEIMAGHSITLCFPEHKILSSAIVGGILPIALGVALGLKRSGSPDRVFCFLGEMTAETGMASSCIKYAAQHDLPIIWVIEDNAKSVCTDTRETWNVKKLSYEGTTLPNIRYYHYTSKYPHAGAGVRVQF